MKTLHLGVENVIYPARFTVKKGEVTTGLVAELLEENYGVMGFFFDTNAQFVADEAVQAYLDVESGTTSKQYGESLVINKIKNKFRTFLDLKEMDNKVKGVPTLESLLGSSKKLKRTRGPVRPSFIDSGLYQDHFTAWLDSK